MRARCPRRGTRQRWAAPPAGRGTSLPVLSGVRVELAGDRLRLTGTDLELTISVEVAVSGGGRRRGRAARGAWRRTSSGPCPAGSVDVEVEAEEARIAAGRSEFSLRVLPADEFPRVAEPAGEPVTLASAELATALRQVVRAASSDDARPILTGVLLVRRGHGPAAGRHRLLPPRHPRPARAPPSWPRASTCSCPSRALQELARVLGTGDSLTVRLGERDASFEVGGTRLTTVLIEGEFPPYERLIPQAQPNRLTVGREVAARGGAPREAPGPRGHPRAPRHVGRRPRPRGHHPGRRPGPRVPRRQVRGHRPHGRVQPRVPACRASRWHPATRSPSRPSTP